MQERIPRPKVRHAVWTAVLFACIGILIYHSSLNDQFLSFDDAILITQNPIVRALTPQTVHDAFTHFDPELYIPLTFVSYQTDYALGRGLPGMFHATNILFHIANAFLVYVLLLFVFGEEWLAILCGLLFLVHPINVEAVSWAAGRKDLLSSFFALASLVAYVNYVRCERRLMLLLSLELFLLALLAKVMPITLPILLFLFDHIMERRWTRKSILEKVPFFVLSCVFGVIALFGKRLMQHTLTIWQWSLLCVRSVASVLQHLVFPVHLHVLYYDDRTLSLLRPDVFCSAVLLAAIIVCIVVLRKRHSSIASGWAFFLVTLIPSFFNLSKDNHIYLTSDRYAYFPMLGLLIALIPVFQRVQRRTLFTVTCCTILLLCGFLSWKQTSLWHDAVTLFSNELRYAPTSLVALDNRGVAEMELRDADAAGHDFQAALKVDPDDVGVLNNAAMYFLWQHQYTTSLKLLSHALAVDPLYAQTHFNLSILFRYMGREQDAQDAFANAMKLDPDLPKRQFGSLPGMDPMMNDSR